MDIMTALALAQIAGKFGGGLMAQRDAQKYNRRAKRSIGRANLATGLSGGRMQVQPAIGEFQPGVASRLLSGLGTAAGLGSDALMLGRQLGAAERQAASQEKLSEQAIERGAMQNDATRRALERTAGAGLYESGGMVPVKQEWLGPSRKSYTGTMPMEELPVPAQQWMRPEAQAGYQGARAAAEQATWEKAKDVAELKLQGVKIDLDLDKFAWGKEIQAAELKIKERQLDIARAAAGAKASEVNRKRVSDARADVLQATPSLKTTDEVATNYLKVKALVKDLLSDDPKTRGVGQVTLVNIMQRGFVDEGVAVRKEDIDNLRGAQSLVDQVRTMMLGVQEGDRFSPKLVQQIDSAVDQLYGAYTEAAKNTLGARIGTLELSVDEQQQIEAFFLAPLNVVPPMGLTEMEPEGGADMLFGYNISALSPEMQRYVRQNAQSAEDLQDLIDEARRRVGGGILPALADTVGMP